MTSLLVRQLWSGLSCSSFLRPTVQYQPSVRTKMVRRLNRHRVPTHAKPSDKWVQTKTVYEEFVNEDRQNYLLVLEVELWKKM